MWLNPIVFKWEPFVDSSTGFRSGEWRRSRELLLHAEQILVNSTTDLDRVNSIMDIRRAIDRRVRLLDTRYSFRSIPNKEKPSDPLGLVEFVGLIRPRMLQKLIDIRDAVEHEDADPPDIDTCEVFVDFAWYFLKSTDFITQRVIDRTTFADSENGCWVEVWIDPPDQWRPRLRGWIPSTLISNEPRDQWPFLKMKRLETRADGEQDDCGYGNKTCDRFFEADVLGSAEALRKLYQIYFEWFEYADEGCA